MVNGEDTVFSIASANDGTFYVDPAEFAPYYQGKKYDFSEFQNITDVVFKRDAVIGVCTDGTLVSAGNVKSFTNSETQAEEFEAERAKMRDAVQIDGGLSTVLKRDGTVENWWNKWEWDASLVQGYHDVVKIAGYSGSMFFLHEDGTVTHAYVGEDLETVVDIGWKDIVDILYYGPMIIGLDKNGTVRGMDIDTGESSTIWENMKKITTSGRRLFGISETGEDVGTLITKVYSYVGLYRVRNFMECQRETTPFMDEPIIEALWGIGEEVGLRSDGTLTVKDYDGDDVSSKYPWESPAKTPRGYRAGNGRSGLRRAAAAPTGF